MVFKLNRLNSIFAAMAVAAIGMAGCNSSVPSKSANSDRGHADNGPSGKAIEPAAPIAKRLLVEQGENARSVATADPIKPTEAAPGAEVEAGKLAAKTGPVMLAAAQPPAVADLGQVEPLDLIMPQVMLTEGEAKTCQVKVGDTLPDVRLPKADGQEETLKDLYGQRLTVVFFWKATHPYAVEELGDLQRLVVDRFPEKQVNVVGIDVQDQPNIVQETLSAKKVQFPNLLDANGAAFAQVATKLMPRTYLVDPQGKILWFDMEYSRSTRRDLLRAIRATLAVNE